MANDSLTLELSSELAERVRSAAQEAGIPVEKFVEQTMEAWLDSWIEDLRRLDEPGEDIPAEDALVRFEMHLRERLAERG